MGDGDSLHAGSRFGPFELLQLLGEGSHGMVWLARQSHPRRKVALKILKGTLADPQLESRFFREVELLAMLEHPGIARLYESGSVTTATGNVHWLAMEYVEGRTLQDWASSRPAPRHCVALLVQLCQAVHFAHTRGVVHRDIKPSNILVDADNHPHIIDFGIAAALDRSDLTRMTVAGSVLGTLPYMSPQQLDGSQPSDPRWDVYALGAIAYELLGGQLPHPGLTTAVSLLAAMKILDAAPPVPLGRISRENRGDLETVVMKAIAREQDDRYGSAAEFANDLQRWQQGLPVSASPPGTFHLLRLFVRRHRALAWSGAAIAATLMLATVVSVHMAMAEADARRTAELRLAERDSVNSFLTDMLLSADPELGAGSDIRVREWLVGTNAGYQSRVATLPAEVRLPLSKTLGAALLHMGEPDRAQPRLNEARQLAARLYGPESPATLAIAIDAAQAAGASQSRAAITTLRALQAQAGKQGNAQQEVDAGISLTSLLEANGDVEAAFKVATSTLARARASLPENAPSRVSAMHNQASMLKLRGDFAEAAPLAREVYRKRLAMLGPNHPLTLYSHNQLGSILERLGDTAQAEAIYRETLAARRAALGNESPSTLATLNNLSGLLIQRGALQDAMPLLDELIQGTRERFGPNGAQTLMAMNQRAYALEDLGQLDAAEAQLREIVAIQQAQGGPMHPERLAPRSNLAMLLSKRGKHTDAIATMRAVVADAGTALGEQHPYVGIFRSNYGEILANAGQPAAARVELQKAQAILEAKLGPDHARTRKNAARLAALGAHA